MRWYELSAVSSTACPPCSVEEAVPIRLGHQEPVYECSASLAEECSCRAVARGSTACPPNRESISFSAESRLVSPGGELHVSGRHGVSFPLGCELRVSLHGLPPGAPTLPRYDVSLSQVGSAEGRCSSAMRCRKRLGDIRHAPMRWLLRMAVLALGVADCLADQRVWGPPIWRARLDVDVA